MRKILEDDGSMVKRMNEFEEGVEQFQAEVGKMRFESVDDVRYTFSHV